MQAMEIMVCLQGVPGAVTADSWPGGDAPAADEPLPAGVVQFSPMCIIAAAPNVVEVSYGKYTTFHVRGLESLHNMPRPISTVSQFQRVGPGVAKRFTVPMELPLIRFFTLDSINGPPRHYPHFN